jgi:hypothetical protein
MFYYTNIAVQNVNKGFDYITDVPWSLRKYKITATLNQHFDFFLIDVSTGLQSSSGLIKMLFGVTVILLVFFFNIGSCNLGHNP